MAHEIFMQRCFDLALQGLGNVAPNPLVGCVIAHNKKIIAEGYHKKFGEAHAEVNAIANVADEKLFSQCTLYVNLEPCSHFGKTPPCVDLIIKKKIPHVVIGCMDTFSEVNGSGIEKLKSAGVKVETDILKNESRELNKRFFTFHEKKRPYVILKWAQTADGFITAKKINDLNRWISNEHSLTLVHKWRSEEQAIMVGANTLIADNPELTVRKWSGRNPLRFVIDKNLRTPVTSKLYNDGLPASILNGIKDDKKENLVWKKINFENDSVQNILTALYELQIQSVIVEGGSFTLQSFISLDLWDEARVFVSEKKFGDGIKAPQLSQKNSHSEKSKTDTLYYYRNSVL